MALHPCRWFSLAVQVALFDRAGGSIEAESPAMIMDKVLSAINYGICVFSSDVLQEFLKAEKIRTKKILEYFQKNPDKYLIAIKEGIWIPFVNINAVEYKIKLDGYDSPFDSEWEQKMEYSGFNLQIDNSVWFTDANSFLLFDKEKYRQSDAISYQTLNYPKKEMVTLYSGYRYSVPSGKYLLTVKGYVRKETIEFPNPNCGFLFSLHKVNGFEGFNNPREEELYNFNIANM